jgi:hypothetical protein
MTLRGTIQNGIIVLDSPSGLPNGTPVTVMVEQKVATAPAQQSQLSDEEYRRIKAIFDEINAIPDENPGDNFSGRDHDKVLYGEP